MAYKEIVIDEAESGSFLKFSTVGDRLAGVFVSKGMGQPGQYGAKMEYKFRTKEGPITVNPPALLAKGFEAAALSPGDKVIATYTGDIAPSKEGYSPTKRFSLKVEYLKDAPAPAAAAAKPKPPPPVPVAADEFDDIPL